VVHAAIAAVAETVVVAVMAVIAAATRAGTMMVQPQCQTS